MAVIETHRTTTAGLRSGVLSQLSSVFDAMRVWNDRRATRKALSQLTTRELEDIGLSRSDIASF